MSRNLCLISDLEEFDLFQTPSAITNEAMKFYDKGSRELAITQAIATYQAYLFHGMNCNKETVEREINRINAFLAFAPNARFVAS